MSDEGQWGQKLRTGRESLRQSQQSDMRPRSVNERVLRSDDSLFTYDDDNLTPVGGRGIIAALTGDVSGRVFSTKVAKSSDYTIADDDGDYFVVDASTADVTLILPTATDNDGRTIYVRHDGGSNDVILDGEGSEQVAGDTTFTLEDEGSYVAVRCNGTAWTWVAGHVLGSNSNGDYIRFSSGVQECRAHVSGGSYPVDITFPKAFSVIPHLATSNSTMNVSDSTVHAAKFDDVTVTGARIALVFIRNNDDMGYSNNDTDYIAIGYWS